MAKYRLDKYPMGSFKKQKSPGKYIDGTYLDNLDIIARNIIKDISPVAVAFSSTLEVGAGKSVFWQQTGECYTELVNKHHGLNLTFTKKNIVFHPSDLIERAFELPKYSVLILDEWEDVHYWSALGITLRQFFRKCRQLNLLLLLIIPNFFQMPMGYAISRTLFAIDVQFKGEFDRGYFSFYNFERKKKLYVQGRKTMDYKVVHPNFIGRFTDGYAIGDKEYRDMKYQDMIKQERAETKQPTEASIKKQLFRLVHANMPEITTKRLAEAFGVSERTSTRYLTDDIGVIQAPVGVDIDRQTRTINHLNDNEMDGGESGDE